MKIKSLNLVSYGKFENKEIEFSDGLNVIYGKNGTGKTTLSTALKAFLYKDLKGNGKYKKNYVPLGEKQGAYDVSFETDDGENYQTFVTAGMTAAKTLHKTIRISDNKEIGAGFETGEFFLNTKEDMYDSVCFIKDTADFEKVTSNNEAVNEKLSGSFDEKRASVDVSEAIENLTKEKLAYSRQTSSGLIFPKEEELSEVKESLNFLLKLSEEEVRLKKEEDEIKSELSSDKLKAEDIENKLKAHDEYREYEKYLKAKKTKDTAEKIKNELDNIKTEKCILTNEEISELKEASDSFSVNKKPLFAGIAVALVFAIAGIFVPFLFIGSLISLVVFSLFYFSDKNNKIKEIKRIEKEKEKILSKVNCKSLEEYYFKHENYKKAMAEKERLEAQLSDILSLVPSEIKEVPFAPEPIGEYEFLKAELEKLKNNIIESGLGLASLEERRKNLYNNLPFYEDIKARKEELEAELEALREDEKVTLAALKMMEITRERYKTSYLPALSKRAEEILKEAEKNADKLVINEKLAPSLREKGEVTVKEKEFLSSGVSDSVYFALKLAVIDLAFENKEKPVIILDDPFIRMDDERTALWLDYLKRKSPYQIIFFTAGKRIFDLGLEKDTIVAI